eukprot:CFRG0653T1
MSNVIQLHCCTQDLVDRMYYIEYDVGDSEARLDELVRKQISAAPDFGYYVVNKADKVVTLGGSTPAGEYWLMELFDEISDGENDFEEGDISASTEPEKGKSRRRHLVRGHEFVAKHFHTVQTCMHCRNPMFGIGMQGYHCKSCGATVHKRCHAHYVVPCGMSPKAFHKCTNCKRRYIVSENHATACRYHTNFGKILCKQCKQPPYRVDGCITGAHVTRETKKHRKFKATEKRELFCSCNTHLKQQLLHDEFVIPFDRIYSSFFGADPSKLLELYTNLQYKNVVITRWAKSIDTNTSIGDDEQVSLYTAKQGVHEELVGAISYDISINSVFGETPTTCLEKQSILWREDRRSFTVIVRIQLPRTPFANKATAMVMYCVTATSSHSSRMLITSDLLVDDDNDTFGTFYRYVSPFFDSAIRTRVNSGMVKFVHLLEESVREIESQYMLENGLTMTEVPMTTSHSNNQCGDYTLSTNSQLSVYAQEDPYTWKMPKWLGILLMAEGMLVVLSAWVLFFRIKVFESMLVMQH